MLFLLMLLWSLLPVCLGSLLLLTTLVPVAAPGSFFSCVVGEGGVFLSVQNQKRHLDLYQAMKEKCKAEAKSK